jgi:hypothetical protein
MPFYKDKPFSLKPLPLYTQGKAVPTSGRRGCLSPDGTTYDKKYCQRNLINQGIGVIQGTPQTYTRAFSKAFSSAFS